VLPRDVLETKAGRLGAFSLLYLSEGIPFGFSAIAMTAHLRQEGVGLTEIGLFTGSLYAPWGFKWAWAPLIDLVQVARFGPRRMWIFGGQVMMILTMGLIMAVDPGADLQLLILLVAVHNVFAATQDVAIDALAVTVLPEKERGVANGFMFGSSYLGQAIGGSGALWIAGAFGFRATFPFVCGMLALILIFVTLRLREPARAAGDAAAGAARATQAVLRLLLERLTTFARDLRDGLLRSGRGPALGVLCAAAPMGAMALGLALGSTMQVDLDMDEGQIAELNVYTTVAAAIGCVLGGWISDRLGHRRMLAVWYVLTTLPTFWLSGRFTGASGMEGVTIAEYTRVAIAYNFTSGLLSGTSIAVFMGLTSPLVAGTQFTGYMALRNLVYTYSSVWQGRMADAAGYAATLRLDAWIAFAPILILPFLNPSTRSRRD
jgi:PAT family beta-lactamase induction signal transducer AmpG